MGEARRAEFSKLLKKMKKKMMKKMKMMKGGAKDQRLVQSLKLSHFRVKIGKMHHF